MKKLSVWLEATHLFMSPTRHQSGIGNYTENIIRSLIELDSNDNFTIFANLFVVNKPKPISISSNANNYNYKFVRFLPGKVWNQLIKRRLLPPVNRLAKGKPDVIINFDFIRLPASKGIKTITVIHDLTFLHYPEYVQGRNLARLKKFVPLALAKSDRVVAVSEHTKQDLVKSYKIDPQRIDVVSNAVNHKIFYPQKLSKSVRTKYDLPKDYILYTGNIEPRKNIVGTIKAFSILPRDLQVAYPLVLVGGKGWNDNEILSQIRNSTAGENIKTLGYVDDKDLPQIYSAATVFIFPSFYEGFGLPVLEAMACGTPVITSKVSSLPDVAGKAAEYIDPTKPKYIAQAIKKLLADKSLRIKMAKEGFEQSNKFSWEQSAGQMLRSIHKAVE